MKKTHFNQTKLLLIGALSFSPVFSACSNNTSSTINNVVKDAYTITLDYSDGISRNGTIYVTKGESTTLPTTPTRKGYTFAGWVDASGNKVDTTYTPNGDITLTATWTTGTCTVTFHANYVGGNDASLEVTFGEYVTSAPTLTRKGYVLDYWTTIPEGTEEQKVDFSTYQITGDFSFYAVWRSDAIQQYTIIITAGEYEGAPQAREVEVNSDKAIAKSNKAWKMEREGYDLQGFTESTPIDGKSWTFDDPSATLPTLIKLPYRPHDNLTLYAVWTIKSYTIVFNENYTDSPSNNGVFNSYSILANGTVTKPTSDPTRTDYSFTGWYTKDLDGDLVDFDSNIHVTSNTGYYAHWKHDEVATKRFQAEYVYINSAKEYFGYSGSVTGCKCIIEDAGAVGTVDVDNYPTNSKLTAGKGYYVSYQYEKGDELVFEFNSDIDTTATLKGNIVSEYDGTTTYTNEGNYGVDLTVNGSRVNYSVAVGQMFQVVSFGTINIKKGLNTITFTVNNTNGQGGTYRAAGFNTDYIELDTAANTTWSPIYDNLEHVK